MMAVLTFYFESSVGSRLKDEAFKLMAQFNERKKEESRGMGTPAPHRGGCLCYRLTAGFGMGLDVGILKKSVSIPIFLKHSLSFF
jgi:hypothetical protein